MTAELTAEQIVTNLLSSNEVIRCGKGNFCNYGSSSLGEYLKKIPPEPSVTEEILSVNESLTKYSFIKNKWEV